MIAGHKTPGVYNVSVDFTTDGGERDQQIARSNDNDMRDRRLARRMDQLSIYITAKERRFEAMQELLNNSFRVPRL
jgi:hypothetical protein